MNKLIRKISVGFAIIVFLMMAIAGQLYGRPVTTCCVRALSGAVVVYVVVNFATRAVFAIFIYAMANSRIRRK